jgi:hypothetical protein
MPTRQLSAHFVACRDGACSLCRPVRSTLILLSRQPQRASSRRQVRLKWHDASRALRLRVLHPQLCPSQRIALLMLGACVPEVSGWFPGYVLAAPLPTPTKHSVDVTQASAARCKAEACPKAALLRQLCGDVAAGEAALEEVAPTRYNLVRLVLVCTRRR